MEYLKVEHIRENSVKITKNPIIYQWWFKVSCFDELFKLLDSEIRKEKIVKKKFESEEYGLLYIGKGKNGHARLVDYHILDKQNFHTKGVENGRLSSLRQTLCGMLELPMSESKEQINNFMDKNCLVCYKEVSLEILESIERDEIKNNYLPLNHSNTKGVLSVEHRKKLTQCKKKMRK